VRTAHHAGALPSGRPTGAGWISSLHAARARVPASAWRRQEATAGWRGELAADAFQPDVSSVLDERRGRGFRGGMDGASSVASSLRTSFKRSSAQRPHPSYELLRLTDRACVGPFLLGAWHDLHPPPVRNLPLPSPHCARDGAAAPCALELGRVADTWPRRQRRVRTFLASSSSRFRTSVPSSLA
jgi:hypothetical protein